MSEPWKVIVCNSEQCLAEALRGDGSVKEEYKIYPNSHSSDVPAAGR